MSERRELQVVGAAKRNEWEPEDRLMRGTCKLAEEDDRSLRTGR